MPKLSAEEKHRKHILVSIDREERKRDTHIPKPRKQWKRQYARKRVRFDTPNIGEMQCNRS